jgi:excisionase family DNA binding protein
MPNRIPDRISTFSISANRGAQFRPVSAQTTRGPLAYSDNDGFDDNSTKANSSFVALLTYEEVARALRVSRRTVARWVSRKEIGHIQLGTRPLIPQSAVDEFLRQKYVPATAQTQIQQVIDIEEITQKPPS